jgi:hypothetical protein
VVVSEVLERSAVKGVGTAGTEGQAGAMDKSTSAAALGVAGSSSTTRTRGSHPLELYSVLGAAEVEAQCSRIGLLVGLESGVRYDAIREQVNVGKLG